MPINMIFIKHLLRQIDSGVDERSETWVRDVRTNKLARGTLLPQHGVGLNEVLKREEVLPDLRGCDAHVSRMLVRVRLCKEEMMAN